MIFDQRTYTLRPGRTEEFLTTYEREGLPAQLEHVPGLVGFFRTEFGPLNQLVHIWGYDNFEQRQSSREALRQDPRWRAYAPQTRDLIASQENKLLLPVSFSPLK